MRERIETLILTNAQLEPFRAFHHFHEELNVYIKVAIASSIVLVIHAADPKRPRELGALIRDSHPAWNMPPIHDFSVDRQRDMYRSTSAFAIVSVFSAFDDFISGIEGDQSRVGGVIHAEEAEEDRSDDSGAIDRIFRFYARNNWQDFGIKDYGPALRYFRLLRNCIAHRSSRASRALEEHCLDPNLHRVLRPLLERTTLAVPVFREGERLFVDPTLAITCSDLLRKIAVDCNRRFIESIGEEGFLRLVAHNALLADRPVPTDAYRSPEAILNFALTDRYRVKIPGRLYAAGQLKKLGIWKDFLKKFQSRDNGV